MMRRILLPLERSDDETVALDFVRSLARRRCIEILLLRVEEWPFLGPFSVGWLPAWRAGDLDGVKAGLDELPGIRTKILLRDAVPSAAVLKQARQGEASLVLLPYRNERMWMRMMYGHTAERLLSESPIPVLAVPGAAAPRPPSRILYPYDGGSASVPGLRHVIDFAQLFDASVSLLRTRPAPPPSRGVSSVEDRLLEILHRREVRAEVLPGSGSPIHDILSSICRGVDLVILSRSYKTEKACAALARDVLHSAAVPLLMTREGAYPEPLVGAGTALRVGI